MDAAAEAAEAENEARTAAHAGFTNVSRYLEGTTARHIVKYVDEALQQGSVTQTAVNAFTIEHSFARSTGTNIAGDVSTSLRVFVRDGIIQTAFPY